MAKLLQNNQSDDQMDERLIDNDFNAGIDDDNEDGDVGVFSPVISHNEEGPPPLQQQQLVITEAPLDRYNFTYIIFYLLGTVTMTPWNFFITAEDYWMYKFRNVSVNATDDVFVDLTPLQKSFACDLTLTASISGTTFLILNAIYGQYVSLRLKMLGTLVLILALFLLTTALVEVDTDHIQEQFFLITLFTVIVINICSATMSGAIFGVAGLFPSHYMTALVSGQALGGICTALTLLLVLTFGAGPKMTAFVYFNIGSGLILISIICYIVLTRKPFYNYYLSGGDQLVFAIAHRSTTIESVSKAEGVALEPNLKNVCGKIYVHTISICLLYTTTLSVYPAISELMQSENQGNGHAWNDIYYMPVVNYLFFNAGDYFGRLLAGMFEKPSDNAHTVLLMTILRMLFIPFFLCANTTLHIFLPVLVHSDIAFIVMMIAFATSNGYLTNILLIMGPRSVKQHEKQMAASILAASLSCGLAIGSILSMMFVQML